MFEPSVAPRLFAMPPGVDFPRAVVNGLRARLNGHPPEAMARVELIVNTRRMARRIEQIFQDGPPGFLPRIRLVTDPGDPGHPDHPPHQISDLRRRLDLTQLILRLLEQQPDLAPRAALFDLADSLAALMDEMQIEGVAPDTIAALDVSDDSGHWHRALEFVTIAQRYLEASQPHPDGARVQRLATELRLAIWAAQPPSHPVILAGSTGSRGTTFALMAAVAQLPQGAVLLPGFDHDLPTSVWDSMTDALAHEDHPQFRFAHLMQHLGVTAADVVPWTRDPAPDPARNRLLSLALRPAPVTHQWLEEGPTLGPLPDATQGVTLLEAPAPREEALAIAMRLRQAVEKGQTAALITPDRMLTRQVTAALDRWNLTPDDSAGIPANLTAPGRFLRHVAALFAQDLTAEGLLTLLKHPLTHQGSDRGQHLINTRDLELHIRRQSWPFPQADKIIAWAEARDRGNWGHWVAAQFCQAPMVRQHPLSDWVDTHIRRAKSIVAGSASDDASELWAKAPGRAVQGIVTDLATEATHGPDLSAKDYIDLFGAVLSRGEVRNPDEVHPGILIWGTLEARVMGADLLILAALNEGGWPESPAADPWLNRRLRHAAGLLLPERRIGLAAHDFQQAAAAPEVWLSRSVKTDDAETVPSRWVNRLINLMQGLPDQQGPEALKAMRARGHRWLDWARVLDAPQVTPGAARPSPAPPAAARPKQLSVTEVKRLIRDPFAIYAKHVLRLRPLNPLQRAPDALMRGILLHDILHGYVRKSVDAPDLLDASALRDEASAVLSDPETLPFPIMRHLWQARVDRVAPWFVDTEAARQSLARPSLFEITGKAPLEGLDFTLTGTADRIDLDAQGRAHVYDYKTGAAPSEKEQEFFDKQLLLEAAMIERGAFDGFAPSHVARALYISVSNTPREQPAPLDKMPTETVWAQFRKLIATYHEESTGFTARRAMFKDEDVSDYDHLARFGEWDSAEAPHRQVLE